MAEATHFEPPHIRRLNSIGAPEYRRGDAARDGERGDQPRERRFGDEHGARVVRLVWDVASGRLDWALTLNDGTTTFLLTAANSEVAVILGAALSETANQLSSAPRTAGS
jgi:hypothetical protein